VLGPNIEPNRMTPQLLQNREGRRFVDVSDTAGQYFLQTWLGRGVAAADYDDDGDLDLLVTHLDEPAELLRNDTLTESRWVCFDLEARLRSSPIGARVLVRSADSEVIRSVVVGGSYLSSGDERLLFSLDGDVQAVDVEIAWPSGRIDRLSQLPVDRYFTVREGTPVAGTGL
jgi:hypothetical protein